MKINKKALIVAILIPLAVGGLSALLSGGMSDFASIQKPPLSPPGWLFPVAWTILYILMGIASFLVYTSDVGNREKKQALTAYGLQLFFNFGWSIIFFAFEQYFLAFVWLVILWVLILVTLIRFCMIDTRAGYLLVPYLLWVTFAGYLNFGVYLLN